MGDSDLVDDRKPDAGLERLVAGFDYPMVVVTVAEPGTGAPSGCLVGFTTQCSIDPARFLVCLSDKNHTYRAARTAPVLAVHALSADRRDLAELFGTVSGDQVDKFSRCRWRRGPHGVPLLDGCRFLVGEVVDRIGFGDHVGFLLAPLPADYRSGRDGGKLLMFSQVRDLEAGHEA